MFDEINIRFDNILFKNRKFSRIHKSMSVEIDSKENKELKEFKVLYDWLRIARKPYYTIT